MTIQGPDLCTDRRAMEREKYEASDHHLNNIEFDNLKIFCKSCIKTRQVCTSTQFFPDPRYESKIHRQGEERGRWKLKQPR